jgi:hypothetical protein
MKSLPKPTHLEIAIDEWKTAQCKLEGVKVSFSWRGDIDEPTVAALVASLPPDPDFVPITLADGRIEWAPGAWKYLRFGKGPPILEAAKHNYEGWAGKGPSSPGARAAQSAEKFTDMIRSFVPDFDNYDKRQQIDYIIRTQNKLAAVRASVEDLVNHLKHATPDRYKAVPRLKDPRAKIKAAVFSDMLKSTRRAGQLLEIAIPPKDEDRHENQTVRKMAKIGRGLLHNYYGVLEYGAIIDRTRKYHQWWKWLNSIEDPREQVYVLLAEAHGTSPELEKRQAAEDGFAEKLGDWVAVVERRLEASETCDRSEDPAEEEDARQTANRLVYQQVNIEETDARFRTALSVLEAPPPSLA